MPPKRSYPAGGSQDNDGDRDGDLGKDRQMGFRQDTASSPESGQGRGTLPNRRVAEAREQRGASRDVVPQESTAALPWTDEAIIAFRIAQKQDIVEGAEKDTQEQDGGDGDAKDQQSGIQIEIVEAPKSSQKQDYKEADGVPDSAYAHAHPGRSSWRRWNERALDNIEWAQETQHSGSYSRAHRLNTWTRWHRRDRDMDQDRLSRGSLRTREPNPWLYRQDAERDGLWGVYAQQDQRQIADPDQMPATTKTQGAGAIAIGGEGFEEPVHQTEDQMLEDQTPPSREMEDQSLADQTPIKSPKIKNRNFNKGPQMKSPEIKSPEIKSPEIKSH
ncbi:hypothetical protein ESCO_004210 [Escovopsis weberi]|uniref:Uncharacterized protein n=1 Tax=Escovopsis weberi TaxID=150374 RepID=A0A0M9VVE3_ESCWE|nr:hypothetical protein ESCO_004210 [Escovopsis weberi]